MLLFFFQEDISEHFATFGEIDNINLKERNMDIFSQFTGGQITYSKHPSKEKRTR